jgi:alpha-1,2-mannosyltransferase
MALPSSLPSPSPGGATTTTNSNNNNNNGHHQENEYASTPLVWWTLILPVYMGWRIWWANRMPILDCDEVYNSWEPLHFMLVGSGLQAWEYAQHYALQTYAYLLPLQAYWLPLLQFLPSTTSSFLCPCLHEVVVVGTPTKTTTTTTMTATVGGNETIHDKNSLALMVLLRATMAASMALAEVCFLEALANYNTHTSNESNVSNKTKSTKSSTTTVSSNNQSSSCSQNLALVTAWLMITSTGMSHALGALLPSTTLTIVWLWAAQAYLKRQFISFVMWAVLATLAIGWPFGVLLFVPLGVAFFEHQHRGTGGGKSGSRGGRGMSSILWLLCCAFGIAVIVQGIVSTIDYLYYD